MTPKLPDTNPKTSIGFQKPSTFAIPPVAMIYLGAAMKDGWLKYGLFNWREHSVSISIYMDAINRHLLAYRDGEDLAQDSNLPHLAHVMACCAILLDAENRAQLNDDRGLPGGAPGLLSKAKSHE